MKFLTRYGVLSQALTVYNAPVANASPQVLSYRGADSFDAGAFYSPYIPLMTSGVVADFLPDIIELPHRLGSWRFGVKLESEIGKQAFDWACEQVDGWDICEDVPEYPQRTVFSFQSKSSAALFKLWWITGQSLDKNTSV